MEKTACLVLDFDELLLPPRNPSWKLPQKNETKHDREGLRPHSMELGSSRVQRKASGKGSRKLDLNKVDCLRYG